MALALQMESWRMIVVVIACLLGVGAAAVSHAPIYKDPSAPVESRVSDLLNRMSLAEKIGQMVMLEEGSASADVIRELGIGSVLSGGGSRPRDPASASTPSVWADMIDGLQSGALSTRLGIPIIYGVDAVHGHSNLYGTTIFPHNIGLGATRDTELVGRVLSVTATEMRATGMNFDFAPQVSLCRDPRWGRCYECFGEEPSLVAAMTASAVAGLQGVPPSSFPANSSYVGGSSKVIATAKAYVGDGGTSRGVDKGNTALSFEELERTHLVPFVEAVSRGVSAIMISYSSYNGRTVLTDRNLITTVLKNQLHFNGIVISDWQGIERIVDVARVSYETAAGIAINAGLDVTMEPAAFRTFITTVTNHVNSGVIPLSRINDAVSRILRVKFMSGIFEQPYTNRTLATTIGSSQHRLVAREAVRKSLVLLKNGRSRSTPLLPLSKRAKILVAGSHANDIGLQCGGWTVEWQGGSGAVTLGTTILQGIINAAGATSQVVYQRSPTPAFVRQQRFSYAIVVVGEQPYAEDRGDNTLLTLSPAAVQTIRNVCSSVRCVVVLISGRPVVVEPFLNSVDALVAAWLPGSEGDGVADVLFGDYKFQGKLPKTWFRTVSQLPINVGDRRYSPLFPYGYGLTQ